MNLTKNDTRYIPQRVLDLAYELGVHEDCVDADLEGACSACLSMFHTAFDAHYGHLDNANDVLMTILNDILEDTDNALQ